MEELQDAIEDAQYMNAMNDDIPKPTKEWVWPTKEELNDYVEKLRSTSPKVFEAEGLCKSGSLGFYMVMRSMIMQKLICVSPFLPNILRYEL
jgi:hypothetical protein